MKLFTLSTSIFTLFVLFIFNSTQKSFENYELSLSSLIKSRSLLKADITNYRTLALTFNSYLVDEKKLLEVVQGLITNSKLLLNNVKDAKDDQMVSLFIRLNDAQNELIRVITKDSYSRKELISLMSVMEQINNEIISLEEKKWNDYLTNNGKQLEEFKTFSNIMLFIYILMYSFFLFLNYIKFQNDTLQTQKQTAEDLYTSIFEALNEGLFFCTNSGIIKACNSSAGILLGKGKNDLIGKNISGIFRNHYFIEYETSSESKTNFNLILESSKSLNALVMAFHDSNSNLVWLSLNTQPVKNKNKENSVILSFSNITDKVNSHKLIKSQQVKIIESSKHQAIGEIASGIAHEINNPLAIISMSIERLDLKAGMFDSMDSIEVQKITTRVLKTVDRITKVVKGFLNYSRGESLERESVSVKLIMSIALDLYQMKLNEHNIDLMINNDNMDTELTCNPTQIAQVLINLIKNATHAISNLDNKWIRIEVNDLGGHVEISIEDSGSGMTEKLKEDILKPFFTTKGFGDGTGLGLSISQTILDDHNGELSIITKPNTKFIIKLPKVTTNKDVNSIKDVA